MLSAKHDWVQELRQQRDTRQSKTNVGNTSKETPSHLRQPNVPFMLVLDDGPDYGMPASTYMRTVCISDCVHGSVFNLSILS